MRVPMYSWLFMADSAATRITTLKIAAAPGTCSARMTLTNGLSSIPASGQGTIASTSASVSR